MRRLTYFVAPRKLSDAALVDVTAALDDMWREADAAGDQVEEPMLWAVLQLHLTELQHRMARGPLV